MALIRNAIIGTGVLVAGGVGLLFGKKKTKQVQRPLYGDYRNAIQKRELHLRIQNRLRGKHHEY